MFREGQGRTGKFEGNGSGEIKHPLEPAIIGAPLLAVDLGSRKIRLVAGSIDVNERVEIIRATEVDSCGITKGIITDAEATANAVLSALEDLTLFLSSEIKGVFVGIPGNHVKKFNYGSEFFQKNKRQTITSEDVAGYIRQTLAQIELSGGERLIHFYPLEFFIDDKVRVKNPVGFKGKKIVTELQVVTGQIANIESITACLAKAGLEVNGFIPSYMASCDAVLSEEEKKEGVAVLDIGSAFTQIAIYNSGILRYSGLIPFGGGIITEDIKEGFFIIRNEAELLKVKAGSALSDKVKGNEISTIRLKGEPKEVPVKNLARIIQARMEEILDMIMLEIKNSGFETELKKGIVLNGGGALMKNLELLVNRHTGFPARIGYPVERLTGGLDMEFNNPVYSTGLGLLIKGYELLKAGIPVHSEMNSI